jgi:isoleucyl-tRNA synthetase
MADPTKRFPDVPGDINFPRDEERILRFWKERKIFEQTLEARKGSPKGPFVFYEGPPTANGMPHNGHVLTRVMKDLFPRYRTMRGYHVPRKAGWDTHGLPVETEVEKELRIHGKAAIEEYGVEPFTEKCIESVFRYTSEWERLTERIGFWVDQSDAYVTFHRSYVESVWWGLSELFKKGLLYRGHKVVWWWAQGGTALSSAEVGWGYKTVDDPSAFVAFPLRDLPPGLVPDGNTAAPPDASLLVWTTTPWTLPSNMYAAVRPDARYVALDRGGTLVIVADALADELAKKLKATRVEGPSWTGAQLAGLRYTPPFDLYAKDHAADVSAAGKQKYWLVLAEDFVTLDTGTGIVHLAPAFGEDDHRAHQRRQRDLGEELELFCAVKPDGTFVPELTAWAGRWVKGADDDIALDLKQRELLLLKEQYRHQYPYCWRADKDPLIQYARPAWYIRTTSRVGDAMANNEQIAWYPEHIKEGRFGDFLRNNVDWALSRERYWGTPLPVWENRALAEDHPDRYLPISGLEELRAQPDSNLAAVEAEIAAAVPDKERAHHLLVHKPWIDRVTFTRPGIEGTYRRVTEVIDVWFDSGCMPFAQWGFPHAAGSLEKLREAFPADFISEAIDQTRGWFYSLLMVSTLLFDEKKRAELGLRAGGQEYPHPYKTCIVLGHVCDREGIKESKSKGNYTPPEVILERVCMEFGVVDEPGAEEGGGKGARAQKGAVLIAREDLEGLDLQEGAKISAYRADAPGKQVTLEIRVAKGMKRRIALLHADDRAALSLAVNEKGGKLPPVEVPRLAAGERVMIEDPTTPAPGADAFRWFFYSASPPWTNTRHSLSYVRSAQKDFVIKLRNVFSFFTIYANIDAWRPSLAAPAREARPQLDRWILGELQVTVRDVGAALETYGAYDAAQKLLSFVEALSNWYVRRSRERFWAPGVGEQMGDDKRSAYATLHACLLQTSKLIAPFVPFFAEDLYLGLTGGDGPGAEAGARASVHLEDYPEPDLGAIDEALSTEMAAVRELVSLGLQVRTGAKLKVRQPLRRCDVVLSHPELAPRLEPHLGLLLEELNVHEVKLLPPGSEGDQVRYRLKPNFRVMGPKVGKKVQLVKQALEKADAGALRAELVTQGSISLSVDGESLSLTGEDIEIAVEAAEGFAAAGGRAGVVVLHTALDQDLLDEGLSREIQSRLQAMRREAGLGFTDRVLVAIEAGERVGKVIERWRGDLTTNVLIDRLDLGAPTFAPDASGEATVDGEAIKVSLRRA